MELPPIGLPGLPPIGLPGLPPIGINPTSSAPSHAAIGHTSSGGVNIAYQKPLLDLENPVHLAVLGVGALLVFAWLRKP